MGCILLVEDDHALAHLMDEVLADEGHTVFISPNSLHALEILAHIQVDLIITDLLLPRLDAITLCHTLHTNPSTATIPVILYSTQPESMVANQCIYSAFLAKPFTLNKLLHLVSIYMPPA